MNYSQLTYFPVELKSDNYSMNIGVETENQKLISLQSASGLCEYTQEYLSLRARQGKLVAEKKGRVWFTTMAWLSDYVKKYEGRKKPEWKNKQSKSRKPKISKYEPTLKTEETSPSEFSKSELPIQIGNLNEHIETDFVLPERDVEKIVYLDLDSPKIENVFPLKKPWFNAARASALALIIIVFATGFALYPEQKELLTLLSGKANIGFAFLANAIISFSAEIALFLFL